MTQKSFEESLKKLERLVQELESGDLSLEKALQKFEEGIGLSKHCSQILDEAEKRVNQLIENEDGHITEVPMVNDGDEGTEG